MVIVPLTLKQANALVADLHRHHKPVHAHRFSIGAMKDDRLVGAAITGAAARTAKAMGFWKIQTFILEDEPGTSLLAAGWEFDGWTDGGDWNRPSRGGRRTDQPMGRKQRWKKILNPRIDDVPLEAAA